MFVVLFISGYKAIFSGETLVRVNGAHSPTYREISGVPQASELGPLLFYVIVNDDEAIIKHSFSLLYPNYINLLREKRRLGNCSNFRKMHIQSRDDAHTTVSC